MSGALGNPSISYGDTPDATKNDPSYRDSVMQHTTTGARKPATRRLEGSVRWTTMVLAVSLVAFVVSFVVEGFWGAAATGGRTNWVDQTFGFVTYLAPVIAAVCVVLLPLEFLFRGARWLHERAGR